MKRIILLILALLLMFNVTARATQDDMDIGGTSGAEVRAEINLAIKALASTSTGATAPSTTFPGQFWRDTAVDLLRMRNNDNDAWITIGSINENIFTVSNDINIKTVSSYPYTVTAQDDTLVFTGTGTVTLPQQAAVSSATLKEEFVLMNGGTGEITLAPFAGDSLPETILGPGESITYNGNGGTAWKRKNAYTVAPGLEQRTQFVYTESLDYDGGSVLFVVGETVTGNAGGTGVIVALTGDATSGTFYINTRNAIAYVNDEVLTGSASGAAVANQASSKNSIVLKANSKRPARYHHSGTTERMVYWETDIPYEFTSLGVSDWSYLYLDDSAIVTAGVNTITSSELTDATTEPDFDTLYNGLDGCIFAVFTGGGAAMKEFYHDGGDQVFYADAIEDQAVLDFDDSFAGNEITLTMPKFSTKGYLRANHTFVNGSTTLSWRTNGQTGSSGHQLGRATAGTTSSVVVTIVLTDSSQIIQVTHSDNAATNTTSINTHGWYFPIGI